MQSCDKQMSLSQGISRIPARSIHSEGIAGLNTQWKRKPEKNFHAQWAYMSEMEYENKPINLSQADPFLC